MQANHLKGRTRLLGLLGLATILALTACSGGDKDSNASTAELRPRLEKARTSLDEATSLTFSLTTPKLPSGVTGLLEAEGDGTHAPAFKGKVKVSVSGAALSADVIAVNGTVYAKTGFSPVYIPLDPASLGAPDPAALMKSDGGVSTLLTSAENLLAGKKTRDGSDILTSITGTLPGSTVRDLIPTAAKDGSFDATYRLTDKDVLRDATINGPFYSGGKSVSYTIKIAASDKSVDITAP